MTNYITNWDGGLGLRRRTTAVAFKNLDDRELGMMLADMMLALPDSDSRFKNWLALHRARLLEAITELGVSVPVGDRIAERLRVSIMAALEEKYGASRDEATMLHCSYCGVIGTPDGVIAHGWFEVVRGQALHRWFCSWACLAAHVEAVSRDRKRRSTT